MRHKHADLIHAWAEGAEIEIYIPLDRKWVHSPSPSFLRDIEYRIKPTPKPDVVREYEINPPPTVYQGLQAISQFSNNRNLRLTWDGETGKLKSAEVI